MFEKSLFIKIANQVHNLALFFHGISQKFCFKWNNAYELNRLNMFCSILWYFKCLSYTVFYDMFQAIYQN